MVVDRGGQVRKFLAAEGKETIIDIEAAIAIDPSGNVIEYIEWLGKGQAQ